MRWPVSEHCIRQEEIGSNDGESDHDRQDGSENDGSRPHRRKRGDAGPGAKRRHRGTDGGGGDGTSGAKPGNVNVASLDGPACSISLSNQQKIEEILNRKLNTVKELDELGVDSPADLARMRHDAYANALASFFIVQLKEQGMMKDGVAKIGSITIQEKVNPLDTALRSGKGL